MRSTNCVRGRGPGFPPRAANGATGWSRSVARAAGPACALLLVFEVPASSGARGEADIAYEEYEVTDGGSIAGRVYFEDEFPESGTRKTTADVGVCGTRVPSEEFVVDPDSKGLANVVLRLVDIEAGKPFAAASAELQQLNCRYAPHVSILRAGERLNIVNRDPILHNIHAYRGDATEFNLAQPRQDQVTPKRINAAGVVRVACDVHDWMEGWVIVVDNPYVALTDAGGHFEIADVPPGDYVLTMWHEVLGSATKPVAVRSGQLSTVDFEIGG